MRKRLEARWQASVDVQTRHYNKKYKPMTYKVSNKVYLNSKNIESIRPAKKLDYKYYGPYTISEAIGKQVYKLKLPPSMKIHNVFYVLLLKPYTGTNEPNNSPPPPIEVERQEKYEVEEILDSRIHYNKLQYLVKWMGYPHSDNQWLPKDDVTRSQDLVSLFHKIYPNKPDKSDIKKRKVN